MLAKTSKVIYNTDVYPYPYPCIYKLIFGNDFYIGKTINLDQRVKQHETTLRNNHGSIKLQKAYDDNNGVFCVEVVEAIDPNKDALFLAEKEKYYVLCLKPPLNDSHYGGFGMAEESRTRAEENKNGWGAKYLKPIRKDLIMTNAESVKKHHAKLDEFKIRPYIEEGKTIREYASKRGMSVQGLFLLAVKEYMENHKNDP